MYDNGLRFNDVASLVINASYTICIFFKGPKSCLKMISRWPTNIDMYGLKAKKMYFEQRRIETDIFLHIEYP